MDIYTLLKKDHDELKAMLGDLASGHEDELERMVTELKAHTEVEEQVFYRSLEGAPDVRDLVNEGYEEHQKATGLSHELTTAKGLSRFREKAAELKDAVEHHIESEEGEVFERAKSVLSREAAESMGREFEQRKGTLIRAASPSGHL